MTPGGLSGLPPFTPTLQSGVPGPKGQPGYLLRAPEQESLAWDLENEIATTGHLWLEELGGWWVAASYFETLVDLILRTFPSVLVLDPVGGDRLLSRGSQPE